MANLNSLGICEYLIKNCGFKPFSHTQWYAYAGAERFDDGTDPIIKVEEDFDIIYDRNGFSFESEQDSVSFNNQ